MPPHLFLGLSGNLPKVWRTKSFQRCCGVSGLCLSFMERTYEELAGIALRLSTAEESMAEVAAKIAELVAV